MSVMGGRVEIQMAAVVCCLHGAPKRQVTDLVFDRSREQASACPCCENLFATDPGDPVVLCHTCRPREAR